MVPCQAFAIQIFENLIFLPKILESRIPVDKIKQCFKISGDEKIYIDSAQIFSYDPLSSDRPILQTQQLLLHLNTLS